ncbi:glycogenin 1 isoform X1 [Dermatophagoides pteronyssinus]|uniref:glycogenin 1 isoform X1 n=1 Tax=Dermatophagoides pteronyssinus TaxID=6956 RepID=UPI003F6724F9
MSSEAFVTLATNDNYAIGAMVLASSLRKVGTQKHLFILITDNVSDKIREVLNKFFDTIQLVNLLKSPDPKILEALKRPELSVTLTKLYCWKLIQFTKCIFMDADTLVVQNIDELFERQELSAVPDIGWPDCFNSGVFVYQPSEQTFNNLIEMAARDGSFDGGDQGLLNQYFSDWSTKNIDHHLSFIYNMTLASTYSYLPAFKRFGKNVKVIHFLGSLKPWYCSYNASTKKLNTFIGNDHAREFIEKWWQMMVDNVHPVIEQLNIVGSMSSMAISNPNQPSSSITTTTADDDRYQAWQQGQMDYLGADSYDNIQKRLDQSIHGQQ